MKWIGLGYSVPAEPSKNRVYVWRKLKELGACYFKQGVAILPANTQSMAKFSTLAAKIRDMGGDATLVHMQFVDPRDEAETIERFRRQSENEYQELLRDCAAVVSGIREIVDPAERRERIAKVVKRLGRAKSRDFFHSQSRDELTGAFEELAGDMAGVTDEIGRQIRGLF